jgi:hypothetical protein
MPVQINGATSGSATLQATDAQTVTLTLPATSGTLAVGGTTPSFSTLTVTGNTNLATSSGSVGIGTSSPRTVFDVSTGTTQNSVAVVIGPTSGTATVGNAIKLGFALQNTGGGGTGNTIAAGIGGIQDSSGGNTGALGFYTQSSAGDGTPERMRITSGGVLALNTTTTGGSTPGQQIIYYAQNANWGMYLNETTGTATAAYAIAFGSNGTLIGRIQTTNSSTTYVTSSDYRLKENIAPMTGALDKVALLKPVTYKWKLDGTASQGFIAHELQAVVPECVVGTKDEVDATGKIVPQGVDTSYLVATLTAAIQELKATVDAQAARIASLEGAK